MKPDAQHDESWAAEAYVRGHNDGQSVGRSVGFQRGWDAAMAAVRTTTYSRPDNTATLPHSGRHSAEASS